MDSERGHRQSFVFSPCESTYADGTYELALSNDKGIDLDVFDASTESGANVQVHTNNGGYAQKWHVTTRDDGYCTIESLCSGKVLAIEGGNAAVGANVCQQTADGTDSQLWKLVPLGNGAYRIASKSGEFALSPFGEERRARLECGRIVVHPEENPDHHRRLLHHRRIHQPVGEARCARCLPRKRRERAAAYRERFERAGGEDLDERRRILHDRVPLLAQGARCGQWWAHPAQTCGQCTPFGNDAQKWYPKYAGDQSFSFVCKGNGLALDIADGIAESGTNVQVYTRNNSIAQRFVLTPTTYVPDDFSDLLAHFSTVSTNTFNGWYNMSRALSNFDGMVVWPGETGVVLRHVRTVRRGRGLPHRGRRRRLGLRWRHLPGVHHALWCGGARRSHIVERQNHTTPSTYVPIGQDAMVNWGSSDFRFRNDWDFPVKIVVDNYDRTLNCDIWGIQPDWYDYIDVSSWWTGSHSAAAQREYYKDGVIVATSALPNSWYW